MDATRSCGTQIFLANATPPWLGLYFATEKKKGFVAFFATKMPQIFEFTNKNREIGEICGMSH